jgi:hypothetical protein
MFIDIGSRKRENRREKMELATFLEIKNNLTSSEYAVLISGIIGSDFHQESGSQWVGCVEDYAAGETGRIRGRALSGVMSSLVKKGYIWTDGETCGATPKGMNIGEYSGDELETDGWRRWVKWQSI